MSNIFGEDQSHMKALQNDQEPPAGPGYAKESPVTDTIVGLMRTAKPIGVFAGPTDFVIRLRHGEIIAPNSGDQGGGQN